jgi:hypothetical protein
VEKVLNHFFVSFRELRLTRAQLISTFFRPRALVAIRIFSFTARSLAAARFAWETPEHSSELEKWPLCCASELQQSWSDAAESDK